MAGRIFTVAGALRWRGPADGSGLATRADFGDYPAVAVMPDGGFLIAETLGDRVLRVWPSGRIARVAGGGSTLGDGGPATSASLAAPYGVAALPHGGFLIADSSDDRVRRVWPDGHISTVAGTGVEGFSGDGGPATSAALFAPEGVAPLPDGGFLIADAGNERIRRVWPDGHISTVAGNGGEGFSGDGGPATRASLADPAGVAGLADGGFVIADESNFRVRRVWPDGRIATVAGNGSPNLSGDGRRATSAGVADVASLAGAPGGGFLIAATNSPTGRAGAVRRVWPDGHISSLVAGVNGADYGDGGPATAAGLYRPDGEATSVAALPDGGTLIGYGTSVRLIVGRHGTRLLAAAIRSPAGVASAREYRARVVLTRPAHVTLRVYHSLHGRPVAIARDNRPAGESTVTIPFNRRVTPGLYAIDLTARRRSQATRAEQYVYLGGSVTRGTIRHIESQTLEDEFGNDPNAQATVDRCHQYTALRVDCLLSEYDTYVEALWLTPQGQLRARTYRPDGPEAFNPNPHWNGPAIWADLGAAWNP